MFSSTTIASSMTMPTISVSASMVIWFSVKPRTAIAAKAPMIEVGIAMAAMSVDRRLRRKTQHDERGEDAAEHQVLLDGVAARR